MKYSHSQQRASERYYINDFNPRLALNEVLSDRCILIERNYEKYSCQFLIKYLNKYIVLVTDYNLHFVKTCLPFNNNLEDIDKLIKKINTYDRIAA